MLDQDEIPVIFRETKDGEMIALLPTVGVESGIDTSILAYSSRIGTFISDAGVMNTTKEVTNKEKTWPLLFEIANITGIKPLAPVKRIMSWMDDIRLDNNRRTMYMAVA